MTANTAPQRRADTLARLELLAPRLVPYGLAAAWATLLGLLWRFEAPSLLHTLAATFTALGLAIGLIELAARAGYVVSRNAWLVAFLLKLTLAFVITGYLWAEPLTQLDLLRVPVAGPGIQDSNLYDYQALQAAQNGFRAEYINFTWQSTGIAADLAAIYTYFVVSVYGVWR